MKQRELQSENKNENKVPVDTAQTDTYLISERTGKTSSVSPPREPQPPTPAPVTPHRLDSGSPGNRNRKSISIPNLSVEKSLKYFTNVQSLHAIITVCKEPLGWYVRAIGEHLWQ